MLFLDDDPYRTKRFRSEYPHCKCFETAQAIIKELEKGERVDQLLLDHDLGGETFVNSNLKNTGMEVVRWITNHKPEIDSIIVHSMNYSAGKLMTERLKDIGYEVRYIPFCVLLPHKKV